MELRDGQRPDEALGLIEEFGRLAACAHDDIDTDEGVGHQLAHARYLIIKECRVVATVHQSQHLVAARLQRDMEMRHEGTAAGAELQHLVRQQVGFDAGDAVALDAFDLVQGTE